MGEESVVRAARTELYQSLLEKPIAVREDSSAGRSCIRGQPWEMSARAAEACERADEHRWNGGRYMRSSPGSPGRTGISESVFSGEGGATIPRMRWRYRHLPLEAQVEVKRWSDGD